MSDDLAAWVDDVVHHERSRNQILNGLRRITVPEQLEECKTYVLYLLGGERSKSAIMLFLRTAARLARHVPHGPFMAAAEPQIREWLNTRAYPDPMPVDKPWPKPGQGAWVTMNRKVRKDQQDVIERFLRRLVIMEGKDEDAASKASRARIYLTGLDDLPALVKRRRPDPTPADWDRLRHAIDTYNFAWPPMRAQVLFITEVLLHQGNRAPALCRATIGDLKLELEDQKARINKTRGPRNKPNPTLYLNEEALAAGSAWLDEHPWAGDDKAPLIVEGAAAQKGICEAMEYQSLSSWMQRLSKSVGLKFTAGSRAIRYYGHDEAATAGQTKADMDLRWGRGSNSEDGRVYVHFTEWRVIDVMQRIRGTTRGRHCKGCRRPLAKGQGCDAPSCPRHDPNAAAPSNAELLGDLGLHALGHQARLAAA